MKQIEPLNRIFDFIKLNGPVNFDTIRKNFDDVPPNKLANCLDILKEMGRVKHNGTSGRWKA